MRSREAFHGATRVEKLGFFKQIYPCLERIMFPCCCWADAGLRERASVRACSRYLRFSVCFVYRRANHACQHSIAGVGVAVSEVRV